MNTSLASQVHALWEDTPALTALIPSDRFTTGRYRQAGTLTTTGNPTRPHCCVSFPDEKDELRSNTHHHYADTIRFQIWASTHASMNVTAEAVIAAYDEAVFSLGDDKHLSLDYTGSTYIQESDDPADTVWQAVVSFSSRLLRPR